MTNFQPTDGFLSGTLQAQAKPLAPPRPPEPKQTPIFTPEFLSEQRGQGIGDDTVADYMAAQNPAFRQQLMTVKQRSGNDPRAVTAFLNWRIYGDANYVDPSTEPKNIFQRAGDAINKRVVNAESAIEKAHTGQQGYGSAVLQTTGQMAGAVNDAAGATFKGAGKVVSAVTPDFIEQPVVDTAKAVGSAVLNSAPGQYVVGKAGEAAQAYEQWKLQHPEAAANLEATGIIGEAGLNLYGAGKLAEAGVKGVTAGAEALAKRSAASAGKKADMVIEKGIEKGIRPSVRGVKTASDLPKLKQNAKEAVKSIIDRKDSLRLTNDLGEEIQGQLPKNLSQFSQAIEQTKKGIFEEYSTLTQTAGGKGASIDLSDIAGKLDEIAANKAMKATRPEVAGAAKAAAERMRAIKTLTPQEAEEAIKNLNASLQSFYVNGSNKVQAQVEGSIANILREKLDDVVSKATGEAYAPLKRKYGALKAIEKDVINRALVDARKNTKGLIDFTDIFTGGDLTAGVLSMNPALIGKAGTQKIIQQLYKRLNNPNLAIDKMFRKAESLLQKSIPQP